MMLLEVIAKNGAVHSSFGSNIIEGFEAGTVLVSYGVNGRRFPLQSGEMVAEEGTLMIALPQIREAIRQGAPRTWKALATPGPGAAA